MMMRLEGEGGTPKATRAREKTGLNKECSNLLNITYSLISSLKMISSIVTSP